MENTVKSFPSASLVAVIQAVGVGAVAMSHEAGLWPGNVPAWRLAALLIAIVIPTTMLILWEWRRDRLLAWFITGLTAFLCWAAPAAIGSTPGGENEYGLDAAVAGFVVPLALVWLLGVPLLQVRLEAARWVVPYAVWFRVSTRTYLLLLEAVLFTAVFWGLLGLCAALFATLGNEKVGHFFFDARFAYPVTTLAFTVAIQLIRGHGAIVDAVRDQLLGLLKWLAPISGLIVAAFVVALLSQWSTLLGSGERIIDSGVLLVLVGVTLALINAAYRDGGSGAGYGDALNLLMRVVPLLLLIVALTAMYSITLRTVDLGLTPARYWGLVVASVATLFCAGYVYAAVRPGPWFGELPRVNFVMACAVVILVSIGLTPLGSARRWSVTSQWARAVQATSIERRDSALQFLRFDAGEPGRRALERLASDSSMVTDPALRDAARRVTQSKLTAPPPPRDRDASPERYRAWRVALRVLPNGHPIPEGLESALRAEFDVGASRLDPREGSAVRLLSFVDFDGDGIEEAWLTATVQGGRGRIVRGQTLFVDFRGEWRTSPQN